MAQKSKKETAQQILENCFVENANNTQTIKNLTKELASCRRDTPKVENFKNLTKELSKTKKDLTKVTAWLHKYAEDAASCEESINTAAKNAGMSVQPYKFIPGVVKLFPDLIKKDRQIDNEHKEAQDQEEETSNNNAHYAPPPASEPTAETITTAPHSHTDKVPVTGVTESESPTDDEF